VLDLGTQARTALGQTKRQDLRQRPDDLVNGTGALSEKLAGSMSSCKSKPISCNESTANRDNGSAGSTAREFRL